LWWLTLIEHVQSSKFKRFKVASRKYNIIIDFINRNYYAIPRSFIMIIIIIKWLHLTRMQEIRRFFVNKYFRKRSNILYIPFFSEIWKRKLLFLNSVTIIFVIPIYVYRLILNTYRSKQKYIRRIMKHRFNENRKVFYWKLIVCKMLMSSHISALRLWFMAVLAYLFHNVCSRILQFFFDMRPS